MATKLKHIKVNWMALAFLVLALAFGWAINRSNTISDHKLYVSQLQSCARGNVLRTESNNRIASHLADTAALKEFLLTAAQARFASYKALRDHNDLATAHEYERLIIQLDVSVNFQRTPLVNCRKVIAKP